MKINQLFTQQIPEELLARILTCYGLSGFSDKRTFCKQDLVKISIVSKLEPYIEEIKQYYLPCKAKIYVDDMDERKSVTMLKQILRLHGYFLFSKERNFNNRKIMFYTLKRDDERDAPTHMQSMNSEKLIRFD